MSQLFLLPPPPPPSTATDPALLDTSLLRKLRSNREVAVSHLEEVISKYANKQEDSEELERLKRQEKKGKGVRRRLPPPALSSWGSAMMDAELELSTRLTSSLSFSGFQI